MNRLTLLPLLMLATVGCGGRPEAKPRPAPAAEPAYSISSDLDEGPARRAVEVKLRGKVATEALRAIALEVKAREERPHERTVIFFYLPAAFPSLGDEAWASAYFNPELKVEILGLAAEQEAAMRAMRLDHPGKRIGAWLQDNQYRTLDLIYDDAGVIKLAEIRSPTERSDTPMVEVPSADGRRFKKATGSNLYDIDRDGNLRISNQDGQVISAARPIQ